MRIIGALLIAGTCLAWSGAAWGDVQACLAASEKGQKLRSQGKLREARDNFVVCGGEGCPSIVRHDCAQWNSELASTLPTVVFGAKDKGGKDLFDVTVTMDGEKLVTKLDGKSVTVDPGKHSFKFESGSLPSVTETALIKEGEKARQINVTFDSGTATPATPTNTTATPKPIDLGPNGQPNADKGGGHTLPPWIVVGLGGAALVAGVVIFVTTPDRPANCDKEKQTCTRSPPDETDAQLARDKDRAGTADSQPILGGVIAGIGAVLVAGGLAWHFLEPTDSKSAVRVTPWTTGKSSGFGLGGSF
jgi:hypothetical protein